MRLMFPRALTVAAAVLGGAGAMAFPKLILRDVIPAQDQGPAFAAPVPAPAVPVIRVPREVTAAPRRHVAPPAPAPKPPAVTARPVAVRTQLPSRPRPTVAARAHPAPASPPAPAGEVRPSAAD